MGNNKTLIHNLSLCSKKATTHSWWFNAQHLHDQALGSLDRDNYNTKLQKKVSPADPYHDLHVGC